eukprot:c6592_g1_i1.p1 GENE.c6592_g1_i1~~c6592_g1_i1.p1  ORF type:complete len:745 (-),score=205.10 c6592_g1_i1:98-2281(-)
MKLYVHLEGTPDLTWVSTVDNPKQKKVQWLHKGFCQAFEAAHPQYTGLPVLPDTIVLSKSAASAKRKLDPDSTIASNNLTEGADLFVHIDTEKATEAMNRTPAPTESKPEPSETKEKKKPSKKYDDPDMRMVFESLKSREIRQMREKCQQLVDRNSHSVAGHYGLAQAFKIRKQWSSVMQHLQECISCVPDNLEFMMELADSQLEAGDLQDALTSYQKGIEFATEGEPEVLMDLHIGVANTMLKAGRFDTAREIIVAVLRKDENHKRGLMAYAQYHALQHKDEEEQLKVMLRLVVSDTENASYREATAELLAKPSGVSFMRSILPATAASAPAYGLLGTIARDFSQIPAAEEFYKIALEARSYADAAYALILVHILELHCVASAPLIQVADYLRRNITDSVGGITAGAVLKCFENILTQDALRTLDDDRPHHLTIEYNAPPDIDTIDEPDKPATRHYTEKERDLLALFFTAAKVLYWTGYFDESARIVNLVTALRHGAKLHMTQIRNENSYFGCVEQLLASVPREPPKPDAPFLYVLGDSHSMPLAWRTVKIAGVEHVMRPFLVTGCKCWHLRPESKFYPKYNFQQAISHVPDGSRVMFVFGEIDCREGMLHAVERGYHETRRDAMTNTIGIYTDVLQSLAETKNLEVFVHPAAPVLNPTRSMVLEFDAMLPMFVAEYPRLHWLQFHMKLLDSHGNLVPDYRLDDTHLNPRYIPLLAEALTDAVKKV